MSNNAFLGVAISIVLIFAILASLATAATEAIARFIGLRAEYLLRGLRTLLVENSTFQLSFFKWRHKATGEPTITMLTKLLSQPQIAANGPQPNPPGNVKPKDAGNEWLSSKDRRNLQSYISARGFSRAVVDIALPDATGQSTLQELEAKLAANKKADASDGNGILDGRLYDLLLKLLRETNGDLDKLRTRLEEIYDEHMQRVSGWYKRHVRWITLVAGAALVLLLNLNAVRVANALYLDQPLRDAVTAQAQNNQIKCDPSEANDCLNAARNAVQPLAAAGLPIGWKAVPDCTGGNKCSWWARYGFTTPTNTSTGDNLLHVLVALLGYLIMALAVLPGARFWYGALDKLNVFRSSGGRPAQTPPGTTNTVQLLPVGPGNPPDGGNPAAPDHPSGDEAGSTA